MSRHGYDRLVSALLEGGMSSEWVRSLSQAPHKWHHSGLKRGQLKKLSDMGILQQQRSARHGAAFWEPGLNYSYFVAAMEKVED